MATILWALVAVIGSIAAGIGVGELIGRARDRRITRAAERRAELDAIAWRALSSEERHARVNRDTRRAVYLATEAAVAKAMAAAKRHDKR